MGYLDLKRLAKLSGARFALIARSYRQLATGALGSFMLEPAHQ